VLAERHSTVIKKIFVGIAKVNHSKILACCSDFPSPNFDCCEWFWVEPITAGWLSHTSLPNRQKQSKAFRPNVAADTSSFPNSPSKKAYHELDVGERLAVCYLQINHIRPQKNDSPAERPLKAGNENTSGRATTKSICSKL
jgi:hypothetical protein